MSDLIIRSQVATLTDQRAAVMNIGQLFEALAFGWEAGSYDNRYLMAGSHGQFIRVDPRRWLHPHYKAWPWDIPIESSGYSLAGFIKFEIGSHFKELFRTARAEDDAWCSAELTQRGYELAKSGLLDFKGLAMHPFFAPELKDADTALAIQAHGQKSPHRLSSAASAAELEGNKK